MCFYYKTIRLNRRMERDDRTNQTSNEETVSARRGTCRNKSTRTRSKHDYRGLRLFPVAEPKEGLALAKVSEADWRRLRGFVETKFGKETEKHD
jgi:hypothetical protein